MTTRPNIVWINTDQQPLANRPDFAAQLPLQSRLASEGSRFTRAYTVLPICSPARASMLTGLYPNRHGLTENDGRFGGIPEISADTHFFTHELGRIGYTCGWFGKWHLSHHATAQDFRFEGVSLPGYGYPYNTPDYAAYLDEKGLAPPVATVELPGENLIPPGTRLALCDMPEWPEYEAGAMVLDGPAEAHEAFYVAHRACEWLREAGPEPFFLRIDPWGPHPPYVTATPFTDRFAQHPDPRPANFWHTLHDRPAHHRDYRDSWAPLELSDTNWRHLAQRSLEQAALVETAMLGVVEALDRLGMRYNTLVIMTADHGDALASNGRCANKGGLLVEETIRIPLLMRGPGIPVSHEIHYPVVNVDLAPTLQDFAAIAQDTCHGRSLRPSLLGTTDTGEGVLIQHYGLHQPVMQRAWIEQRWKLIVQEDGFTELYDLESDPTEMRNLASPAAHQGQTARMLRAMFAEMERIGDVGERQTALLELASKGAG